MIRRLATAAVLATTLSGAPAQAAQATVSDERGDAPPRADIRRVDVDNGETDFTAAMKLQRVVPEKTVALFILKPVDHRGISYVVGTARRHGERRDVLFRYSHQHHRKQVACAFDVDVDKASDRVSVAFAQSCLGDDAGTLKVAALTEQIEGADLDYVKGLVVEQG